MPRPSGAPGVGAEKEHSYERHREEHRGLAAELGDHALKKRRDFHAHLLIYVLVNAALVTIWALVGGDVFFWPMIPMVLWGIGVVMNAWDVYVSSDFSEEQIQRQMHRLQHRRELRGQNHPNRSWCPPPGVA